MPLRARPALFAPLLTESPTAAPTISTPASPGPSVLAKPKRRMGRREAEPISLPAESATLLAQDGTPLRAVHDPAADGQRDLGVVIAHGFTGSWERPAVRRIVDGLAPHVGVVTVDLRGHGESGGHSTLGDLEVLDVDAAIGWARLLGYRQVVTVGFSLGAMVVLRHAGLSIDTPASPPSEGDATLCDRVWSDSPGDCSTLTFTPDAVVAVSSPGRWDFPHSRSVRIARFAIENPVARRFARHALNTRVSHNGWAVLPSAPDVAAARTAGVPLLVVQGDNDPYFTVDHGEGLFEAAADPKELWIVPGFGHAENAVGPDLLARIADWIVATRAPVASAAR